MAYTSQNYFYTFYRNYQTGYLFCIRYMLISDDLNDVDFFYSFRKGIFVLYQLIK